jgi:kynureninase
MIHEPMTFQTGEEFAQQLDAADPLRAFRDEFFIPQGPNGKPVKYFCGNSLGLMPKLARDVVLEELRAWEERGVGAHHHGDAPWLRYHEMFRGPLSRLVGAGNNEVVLMNSLTVNLHLLMVSFYRPTSDRFKILAEDTVFPSDRYALETQIRHHGLDPKEALVQVQPRDGESLLRTEDIEAVLEREGKSIALVLMGGVNFLTGQLFDMECITRAAGATGCRVGFDLAHAVGNVPLSLHDWGVDFAVWCSYKYLNGGPGALAGAYVHEKHAADKSVPRFGGWWGNDPDTRFRMQLESGFIPVSTADGWQLSNPSILACAPLRAGLDLFDRATMDLLGEKSTRLTGYLWYLLTETANRRVEITTPADPGARGCQLSLRIREGAKQAQHELEDKGFVCDFREPDILRVAPTPLYNTYHDVWSLAQVLEDESGDG